jgi:hypothetical protein
MHLAVGFVPRGTEPHLHIVDYRGSELYSESEGRQEQLSADVDALMKLDQSGKAL